MLEVLACANLFELAHCHCSNVFLCTVKVNLSCPSAFTARLSSPSPPLSVTLRLLLPFQTLQWLFLDTLNARCLLHHYGSYDCCPRSIQVKHYVGAACLMSEHDLIVVATCAAVGSSATCHVHLMIMSSCILPAALSPAVSLAISPGRCPAYTLYLTTLWTCDSGIREAVKSCCT